MSIANAIRQAALYDDAALTSDELLNRILSLFMQKGDWLNSWTHAITFALLVAEVLDGGNAGMQASRPIEEMANRCGCNYWLTKPCPARSCPWQGKRPVDGAGGTAGVAIPLRTHTTDAGESLCGIAIRQLGDENRWAEIRDLNADRFPDMLGSDYYPVGTVINLPQSSKEKHK